MIARLLFVFVSLASFARAVPPEIEVTTSKPALGDNLALNLADAVIKSIFPEVAEVEKPRRAPVNRLTADGVSSEAYSPYFGGAYPIPPGNILPAASFPGARFQGRTDLPAGYIYPYAAPGSLVRSDTGTDPSFFLGPQDLANAQNQQYLSYLQQQQQSLPVQQQIYLQQQQLLQAQARPYLPAARQQQYNPDLARQFGATLGLPEQRPQLSVQPPSAAEDGRRPQFGSSNLLPSSASTRVPSFSNADGAYLEEFFKSYGVDLSKTQRQLTADDNETLTILKEQLIQQQFTTDSPPFVTAHSNSGDEPEDIEKLSERPTISSSISASPTTRFSLPEKETVTDWTSVPATKVTNRPTVPTSGKSGSCDSCIPIDLERIVGPWTQIYGNPDAMRQIYSTVQSIQDLDLTSDTVTAKMVAGQPSCVGFQLSQRNQNEMGMNLFFRDDSKGHKLNEMTGTLRQVNRTATLDLELSLLHMPMCVVIAGPTSGSLFEYLVLAETTGVNRCRSHHVFARNTKTFFRKHDSSIADFLDMAVNKGQSLPVGVLPFPRLCQLPTATRQVHS